LSKGQQKNFADMWTRARKYHGELIEKEHLEAKDEGRHLPHLQYIRSTTSNLGDADSEHKAVAEAAAVETLKENAKQQLRCMRLCTYIPAAH
jgi:hypothetical protein